MSTSATQPKPVSAHAGNAAAVPPGYKRTEVGVIPEDWEVIRFSDLLDFRNGVNADKHAYGKGIPFVNVLEVITKSHLRSLDIPGRVSLAKGVVDSYAVRRGDLIFNRTSETQEEVGLCSVYLDKDTVVFGGFVIRGRSKRPSIDETYSGYAFRARAVRLQIIAKGQGAIRANIGQADLRQVFAPLPPLPEQRAIAGTLSDVDGLIGALDKLIVKKRAIQQATMQYLLTGKTRLPGFTGEWKLKCLAGIGDVTGAGVDKKSRPGEVPVRLVNYLDVYRRNFIYGAELNQTVTAAPTQAQRCAVIQGDVFFTPSSEVPYDIANSAVAMEDIPDSVYSYHLVRLRLREDWDLRFRAYAFKAKSFEDQARMLCEGSGTRYVITLPKFRSMTVQVPPRAEQSAIGAVLFDMDAEIAALERRRDKAKAIKQGMMQALLSGRVRLVKPVAKA